MKIFQSERSRKNKLFKNDVNDIGLNRLSVQNIKDAISGVAVLS